MPDTIKTINTGLYKKLAGIPTCFVIACLRRLMAILLTAKWGSQRDGTYINPLMPAYFCYI